MTSVSCSHGRWLAEGRPPPPEMCPSKALQLVSMSRQRAFADMMKFGILRWRDYTGSSGETWNHKGPRRGRGEAGDSASEVRTEVEGRVWRSMPAWKTEGGRAPCSAGLSLAVLTLIPALLSTSPRFLSPRDKTHSRPREPSNLFLDGFD